MTDQTDTALLEIVYSSETPTPLGTDEVRDLLHHAREKNAQWNVTGLLCYDHQRFLQIIEGETDIILDLFHAIQNDPRHTNVRILHEGDIEERAFDDWKMAYEPVPSGLLPALTRAIRTQTEGDQSSDDGMSAGRRIFTLFMNEMYGGASESRETADA